MIYPFEIVRARPLHAKALTDITIKAKRHWGYPETWIQLWLPLLTVTPDYISVNETWVASADNQPIGYYSLKYDGEALWLDNLWVLPEYMGRGIGKLLFGHALERSRVQNAPLLKIEADPNAVGFYERMGARKAGERHATVESQVRVLPILEIKL